MQKSSMFLLCSVICWKLVIILVAGRDSGLLGIINPVTSSRFDVFWTLHNYPIPLHVEDDPSSCGN